MGGLGWLISDIDPGDAAAYEIGSIVAMALGALGALVGTIKAVA